MNLMNPKKALLFNAMTLILIGLSGYIVNNYTPTALIPVIFGILLLFLSYLYDKNNKIVAHIGIVLILIVFISLFNPLTSQIDKKDLYGIVRISLMQLVSFYAIICFVSSFIKARKEIYFFKYKFFGEVDNGCQAVLKTVAPMGLQVRILS